MIYIVQKFIKSYYKAIVFTVNSYIQSILYTSLYVYIVENGFITIKEIH